ncbi:unnamed protein product [Ambrosiozyma monospora]|uniref:Unnamed protein product n=1 Tax=Ambrosiozyma monospora TaxID=43982 RepID=A0A9W6Z1D2_AMBMO|nr:unnamed protein product [Ambrosiozyma monospora]
MLSASISRKSAHVVCRPSTVLKQSSFETTDLTPRLFIHVLIQMNKAQKKHNLFINPLGKPFTFVLCPPLNEDTELIQIITSNGGIIAVNPEDHTIILAKKLDSIPEDYIFSYKVYDNQLIYDTIAQGIHLDFEDYILSQPFIDNSNIFNQTNINTSDNANENLPPNQTKNLRKFTPSEDVVLLEEVRKRPWLGHKGHTIYQEISQLPFFIERRRSKASLRERIKTLCKFQIGYVYKADGLKKLLKDEHGNYIRDYNIKTAFVDFSALEDFTLARTIYKKAIEFSTDDRGYENVQYPTGFFAEFSKKHVGRSRESWRQRAKKYLLVFGIQNYLKYYITQRRNDEEPLPSNKVMPDWLKARQAGRKNMTAPTYYFPNLPLENYLIDEYLDLIDPEEDEDGNIVEQEQQQPKSPLLTAVEEYESFDRVNQQTSDDALHNITLVPADVSDDLDERPALVGTDTGTEPYSNDASGTNEETSNQLIVPSEEGDNDHALIENPELTEADQLEDGNSHKRRKLDISQAHSFSLESDEAESLRTAEEFNALITNSSIADLQNSLFTGT